MVTDPRRYRYVGPPEIRDAALATEKAIVHSRHSPDAWLERHGIPCTFTYVVDIDGMLRLASRHSEHVACAQGNDVLAAGEITLTIDHGVPTVTAVSNQSTGYCPDVASWQVVAQALERLAIAHPSAFTAAIEFRRCPDCQQLNIVRDGFFVCAMCDADLPSDWNITTV